jgi:glycosyltransferase involved in cell wall biosynthesis
LTDRVETRVASGRKPFILITGLYPQGGTYITKTLNQSGLYLGGPEDLMTLDSRDESYNALAHAELMELSKVVVKNLASGKTPRKSIDTNEEQEKKIASIVKRLYEYPSLASGFRNENLPLLLDSWRKHLPENIIVVGAIRHPSEEIPFISEQNNVSQTRSLQLWKNYSRHLLDVSRKYPTFLLDFSWSEERILKEIKFLIQKLGLDTEVIPSKVFFKLQTSLISNDTRLNSEIMSLYNEMAKLANDNSRIIIDIPSTTQIDYPHIVHGLLSEIQKREEHYLRIAERNATLFETVSNLRLPTSISWRLFKIYSQRADLQEEYPEILSDKRTYAFDPLSALLSEYNSHDDLQIGFPEVKNGSYEKLLEWATDVSKRKSDEYSALKPYSSWYERAVQKEKTFRDLQLTNEKLRRQIADKDKVVLQSLNSINHLQQELEIRDTRIRELQNEINILNMHNEEKDASIKILNRELVERVRSYLAIETELNVIKQSIMFKIARSVGQKADKALPDGTNRGKLKHRVRRVLSSYLKADEYFDAVQKDHKKSESLYSRWYSLRQTKDNLPQLKKEASALAIRPKFSIVMPVYNIQQKWLSAAIESVLAQIYDNWELCICDDASSDPDVKKTLDSYIQKDSRIKVMYSETNGGIAVASNNALSLATGDYIALMDHDDEIVPEALFEAAKVINEKLETEYIYTDEDKIDQNGEHTEPFFKPDWSPDLFLSMNYITHFSIIKKTLVDDIGGFRKGFDGSQDYDLLLRVTEKTNNIVHIPKILYNWRKIPGSGALVINAKPYAYEAGKRALEDALTRRQIDATVVDGYTVGYYRVKYAIKDTPLVSIIILNKNNVSMLRRCIESVEKKTSYNNYEIILIDHSSTDPDTIEYIKTLKHKVITYEGKFNFSRMNNIGAKESNGQYFIFLNNDTEVIEPSWIEAMLEHCQREEIGAVGAKLLYPDKSIQHAGIIVGFNDHAHNWGELPKDSPGYFAFANVIRNCSAVTAACIMIRKDVYENISGYDENMPHSWQDVDICLRILDLGKRIVYTPYALLYHITSATRGKIDISVEEQESKALFRKKHAKFIEGGDPYYNPNLSLRGEPYTIDSFNLYTDPLELLNALYLSRNDLQEAYPEAKLGKYERLIDWVIKSGLVEDSAKPLLSQFADYYKSMPGLKASI